MRARAWGSGGRARWGRESQEQEDMRQIPHPPSPADAVHRAYIGRLSHFA